MIDKRGRNICDACGRIKGAIRGGIGSEVTTPLPGYLAGPTRFGSSWHVAFDFCDNSLECFLKAAETAIKARRKREKTYERKGKQKRAIR